MRFDRFPGWVVAVAAFGACAGEGAESAGTTGGGTLVSTGSSAGSTSAGSTESAGTSTSAGPGTSGASAGSTAVESTGTGATSAATTGEGTTGEGPALPYDLDGDGAGDTELAIAGCVDAPGSTCLVIGASTVVASAEVVIGAGADLCDGSVLGGRIEVIGDHGGDGIAEVAALHCRFDGVEGPPALAVVDPAAALRIAEAAAPSFVDHAYADAVAAPGGLRHPFLAPSYGDGEVPGGSWLKVCVFRPELGGDPGCGAGFSAIPLAPPEPVFREVGATVQDLDGDGWEELNLIFHRTIYSVSAKALAPVVSTTFDVAAKDEPASPAWFHSGRNYGAHAAFAAADASRGLLLVGGAPVGSFSDDLCNVSRFVALLRAPAGQPAARALAWSRYFGFSSTIFATYDPKFVDNPMADVARLADVVDGCVHRFGSSRSVMDGAPVVIINYFAMDAPIDYCLDEQFALYQAPAWTKEKADAWYACFGQNKKAPGTWGMQVLRESDGQGLTGSQGTYVWGMGDRWIDGGEVLYLVEMIPGKKAFDLSDQPPTPLRVMALVGGLWQERGALPVAGRPTIVQQAGRGALGLGSYSYVAELARADVDGDGLDEVGLEGGVWVGYDRQVAGFVVKR